MDPATLGVIMRDDVATERESRGKEAPGGLPLILPFSHRASEQLNQLSLPPQLKLSATHGAVKTLSKAPPMR
jgi:hypothetical protein